MSVRQIAYEKVCDNDPEEQADSDVSLSAYRSLAVGKFQRDLNILSHILASFAGIVVCFIALQWRNNWYQKVCTDFRLRDSSMVPAELTRYSETVRYNGTLEFPSIYRGTWAEVDDTWDDVVNIGFLDLDATDEDIKKLDVDPGTLAKFPEEDGGGYVMTVEYTHQIHCLDLLRRVNPWNYPEYKKRQEKLEEGKRPSEEMFRTHVDHCTEMLRQILMCHADTTPIFEQWVSVRGHPWPNFNTVHQCRNFDAIHRWFKEHTKDINTAWPTRPKGAKALPVPP